MMKKINIKIKKNKNFDDFTAKIRQKSIIKSLRNYINWQRNFRNGKANLDKNSKLPKFGPAFINLDLTTACSYACPFCVDVKIINNGKFFSYKQMTDSIDVLCQHGLKSVLLIGGGEPTLHPDFGRIVKYLKRKNLQVGIVTNGSFVEKIIAVANVLKKEDWVRLSLDAGTEKTFKALHRPKVKITLDKICQNVSKLKKLNKNLQVGFSYVITWEGIKFDGVKLPSNINEIPIATKLAKKSGFDYISFKPCMIKIFTTHYESLAHCESKKFQDTILKRIKEKIKQAEKIAAGKIKVVTTQNLRAIFGEASEAFQSQPRHCHIQIFRHILTPIGIYHCPAYRGFDKAKIGEYDGALTKKQLAKTISNNYRNLINFNPRKQCKGVVCFYNQTNRWIEDFIKSGKDVNEIEACEDDNFFL